MCSMFFIVQGWEFFCICVRVCLISSFKQLAEACLKGEVRVKYARKFVKILAA